MPREDAIKLSKRLNSIYESRLKAFNRFVRHPLYVTISEASDHETSKEFKHLDRLKNIAAQTVLMAHEESLEDPEILYFLQEVSELAEEMEIATSNLDNIYKSLQNIQYHDERLSIN